MKFYKFKIIIVGLTALLLLSCTSRKIIMQTTSHTDSIFRDKIVKVVNPIDSANISALLECDENGKVIIKNIQQYQTKNAELQYTLDSIGALTVDFKTKVDTLYITVTDTFVTTKETIVREVEPKQTKWYSKYKEFIIYTTIFILLIFSVKKWLLRL